MLYSIGTNYNTSAQVETQDEIIVAATPAYRWSIGLKLSYLMTWCDSKYISIGVLKDQTKGRSKSLGDIPGPPKDRRPTDSQLARRTGAEYVQA